jgi:short subunit dehydrogenase-like uncharacterized protein
MVSPWAPPSSLGRSSSSVVRLRLPHGHAEARTRAEPASAPYRGAVAGDGPIAVLGATGYTGRLVLARARELGLPLRLVGRRREALEELARPGEDVRVADARGEAQLVAAFDGASVVASLAGPFLALGTRPVAAAIAVGAHYVDVTGEQAFARLVHEGFGDSAAERGVVLLTAFGFLYAPGDLAARLAAQGLERVDEVVAAYAVDGFGVGSAGTRRTVGTLMGRPHVAYERGELVESRFAATAHRVAFPSGPIDVLEWTGTEPLTVPRHTRVRRVRSYVRVPAPAVTARAAAVSRLGAPFVRLSAALAGGPSERRRDRTRWTVVAEAHGEGGGRRATLTGRDVYGVTALLVARAAAALRAGEVDSAGALAPAEAFDARALIEGLSPLADAPRVQDF